MNERIRELAEQAGEYVNEVYTPPVRSKTPGKIWEDGHIEWHTHFNQKFAELIVRECVQTLIDNTPERYTNESAEEDWDKGYDRAMKDCVHHIQEHFGVN
jgi:hypothetical protein